MLLPTKEDEMEMKTENGMRIITDKDYDTIHAIKHKWQELHGRHFKTGKLISEISDLFCHLGEVKDGLKTYNK